MPIDQKMLDEELRRVRESGFGFNPMAGKAAKQKKMRDERKREEKEPTPEPTALDIQAGRQFGFDPNVERLGILPYPRGALTKGSKVDWSDWVAPQVVYDAAKAYALPGYAAQGGDYTPEEVANMAGTVAGGGMALGRAPAGALGMMIGPRSKLWDKDVADIAQQMEREGRNRNEIWQATRTFRAPDQGLRQEIPSIDMSYTPSKVARRQAMEGRNLHNDDLYGTVDEFIEHPFLKEAYPELFNQRFLQLRPTNPDFHDVPESMGFYFPPTKSIVLNSNPSLMDRRSAALHELAHAIQDIEGWPGGTSPEHMAGKMSKRIIEKSKGQTKKDPIDYYSDPFKAYKNASGELEARMVQKRRDYDAEKRRKIPPFMDYEVRDEFHIPNYASGGSVGFLNTINR